MVTVNNQGYLQTSGRRKNSLPIKNHFLVKQTGTMGEVQISHIYFPITFVGKNVRFKVEIVDDLGV